MKVTVVYGSERGGTAGLAEMIAAAFRQQGHAADVRDASVEGPLGDADAVIVGGALYLNRWHPDARRFVREHRRELTGLPVWLFSSGPLDASARCGDVAPVQQVRELAAAIEAHGHMTFGGRLERGAKGLFARSMAKKYAGDWRDPQHVAEWVREICHELVQAQVPVPARKRAAAIPAQRRAESDTPAHA